MKHFKVLALTCLISGAGFTATAQNNNADNKKEHEEIVIRKSGDKDLKMTIQIDGDKITVNGKPISEFKDDAITVNKRNVTVREGRSRYLNPGIINSENVSSVVLGVSTEKAEGGVRVEDVTEKSAADSAGIKEGDIITAINDVKVTTPQELYDAVNTHKPKDEVVVKYRRDGKEQSAKAKLKGRSVVTFSMTSPDGFYHNFEMPGVPGVPSPPKIYDLEGRIEGMDALKSLEKLRDMDFSTVYGFSRQKLGLRIQDTEDQKGVKVLEVDEGSPAETAGLKVDDIVTEIGGNKVNNTDEAREQLQITREKSAYTIKAKRNKKEMTFDIKIPKKLKTTNL